MPQMPHVVFTSSTKDSEDSMDTKDSKDSPQTSPVTFKNTPKLRKSSRKSSAITSLGAIIADGDKEKVFLLKKKQRSFDHITSKILQEQLQQKLTAEHLSALYEQVLFVPSILLTLLSGILAILVKSTLVPSEKAQSVIALSIAVISIVSTFLQSLMKQLNFGGRAMNHESCSASLCKIYRNCILKTEEQEYNSIYKSLKTGKRVSIGENLTMDDDNESEEKEEDNDTKDHGMLSSWKLAAKKDLDDKNHPEEKDDKKHEKGDEVESSITEKFQQALDACNSPIPMKIQAAFNMLEVRIDLVNKSTLRDKTASQIAWGQVRPALYYQLSETILQSRVFPLRIPSPKWSVEKTLMDFKQHLRSGEENHADLVNDLIQRSNVIANIGDNMAGSRKPLLPRLSLRDVMEEV